MRTVGTPREKPENLKHGGRTRVWKLLWARKESCLSLGRKVVLKRRRNYYKANKHWKEGFGLGNG